MFVYVHLSVTVLIPTVTLFASHLTPTKRHALPSKSQRQASDKGQNTGATGEKLNVGDDVDPSKHTHMQRSWVGNPAFYAYKRPAKSAGKMSCCALFSCSIHNFGPFLPFSVPKVSPLHSTFHHNYIDGEGPLICGSTNLVQLQAQPRSRKAQTKNDGLDIWSG